VNVLTIPCNLKKPVVTQSNSLIEAFYALTLSEHRLVALCVGHIQRGKPLAMGTVFEITAKDYAKAYGVSMEDAYDCLRQGADRIVDKSIEVKYSSEGSKPKRSKFPWLARADYFDGQGRLEVEFNYHAIHYLTNLSQRFTTYDLSEIARLTSIYAIRLFELLKQFSSIGTREIEIAMLKKMFKIEGEYSRISNLKAWVIDPALKQINEKTHLDVSYTQRKRGRLITHLIFSFEHKINKFADKKDRNQPRKAIKALGEEDGPAIVKSFTHELLDADIARQVAKLKKPS
jgi:plasmid replication initiation protein